MDSLPKEKLEERHVHNVYNVIADHFSATRYKPWPVIEEFLKTMPDGSLGADVGCGNGKYLGVNRNLFMVGSDRSDKLVDICLQRGFESMVCDNLCLPYRANAFDFVISIAVIHHMSSPARRLLALKELFRILSRGGRALIFVWAFEQQGKRKFDAQDVFVPWKMPRNRYTSEQQSAVLDVGQTQTVERTDGHEEVVYQRYYHLFVKDELDELVRETGMATIERSGYDRDNWYVIARKT
ncbi:tRNA methyltransferase, has a role in tRNA modification [Gaertneriomyces sp. JEL0708]|nr:tRNA methyltransferase, has a role in tRNA modification [Gaertneriomyces sp. JEL0708]